MAFDNENFTGNLRWLVKPFGDNDHFDRTLQQEYKCWNSGTPNDIIYEWRNVPLFFCNAESKSIINGDQL